MNKLFPAAKVKEENGVLKMTLFHFGGRSQLKLFKKVRDQGTIDEV